MHSAIERNPSGASVYVMPACPDCATPLNTIRQREGLFFLCPGCTGHAVTIPQIRRVAGDQFATSLLRQINGHSQVGERTCPFCTRRMLRFNSQDPPLALDACKTCGAVWFDPREFEAVPDGVIASTNEVRVRGAEVIARHRLEQTREKGLTDSMPDETWKIIPALFGFPVEAEVNQVTRRPWVTWSLAVVILVISIWAFSDLRNIVERFGFIPAEAWRYGGLTSLTSFFLHGGILHLVGNLYFFLIFGDNVEDYLGRWRYALLILASTLAGDLTHWLVELHSTIPAIGASGGISGIIVLYALEFPQARLGFIFYFRWMQMPAWVALVLWLLMQFLGAAMQLGGFSNVAATAHLGGAAAGFALWYWWRKIKLRPAIA